MCVCVGGGGGGGGVGEWVNVICVYVHNAIADHSRVVKYCLPAQHNLEKVDVL